MLFRSADCINEYETSVVGSAAAFTFPVPRVWANPLPSTTFSFDSFRASFLILFEIVCPEGWINVMGVASQDAALSNASRMPPNEHKSGGRTHCPLTEQPTTIGVDRSALIKTQRERMVLDDACGAGATNGN